jgi:exopolysaccharide biosynthesis polyprenyl glycosylphosphotransferase
LSLFVFLLTIAASDLTIAKPSLAFAVMFDVTSLAAAMTVVLAVGWFLQGHAAQHLQPSANSLKQIPRSALMATSGVPHKRAIVLNDDGFSWGVAVCDEAPVGASEASVWVDTSAPGTGSKRFERQAASTSHESDTFTAAAETAEELARCARTYGTSLIIVADVQERTVFLEHALLLLRYSGLEVITVKEFVEQQTGMVVPGGDREQSFMLSGNCGMSRIGLASKRALDFCVALVALLALFPVLAAVALVIAVDSSGPFIYRQVRVGRHGRIFQIVKFRTMTVDAERDGRALWATPNDRRITRAGRVLRQFRIDELPQLVNVLRGEMSLVGPRPERPEFVKQLAEVIPAYSLRHLVRPGLTGWAQINYPYGASVEDARNKLGFDLYYIHRCSIATDLFILARTLRVVLVGEGAR